MHSSIGVYALTECSNALMINIKELTIKGMQALRHTISDSWDKESRGNLGILKLRMVRYASVFRSDNSSLLWSCEVERKEKVTKIAEEIADEIAL